MGMKNQSLRLNRQQYLMKKDNFQIVLVAELAVDKHKNRYFSYD